MRSYKALGVCLLLCSLSPTVPARKYQQAAAGVVDGLHVEPPALASAGLALLDVSWSHPPVRLLLGCLACGILWAGFHYGKSALLRRQRELSLLLLERNAQLEEERAALAEARNALQFHAGRDELTGLLNRRSILDVLDREMSRSMRDKSKLSVVLADLDHFKTINDTYGPTVGDEVLKEFGRRVEYAIRSYDAAGRYGGEEFLLLLPNFEGDAGVERLRKIHDTICGKPISVSVATLNVTCSFGVSILVPEQYYSAEELLERAGQAMHTAKHDGRNRIGFFVRSDA